MVTLWLTVAVPATAFEFSSNSCSSFQLALVNVMSGEAVPATVTVTTFEALLTAWITRLPPGALFRRTLYLAEAL